MSWKDWKDKLSLRPKKSMPDGLFVNCEGCQKMIYKKHKEEAMEVCPECDYHFRLPTRRRLELLVDEGTFKELFAEIGPTDPLSFVDRSPYAQRLLSTQEKTGKKDAVMVGTCRIRGREACLGVMDFDFMGGSMGSVVGERVTRIAEHALETHIPLVVVSASGGARMQEGALSLMQMAKTSCALARLRQNGILYISVLTDPTTAGVLASFASLGDIIIAEPKALIGFTGPRVIKGTIGKDLPPGFQRSEFLLEHGLIDMIVHRKDLKERMGQLLEYYQPAVPGHGSPVAADRTHIQPTPTPASEVHVSDNGSR